MKKCERLMPEEFLFTCGNPIYFWQPTIKTHMTSISATSLEVAGTNQNQLLFRYFPLLVYM